MSIVKKKKVGGGGGGGGSRGVGVRENPNSANKWSAPSLLGEGNNN